VEQQLENQTDGDRHAHGEQPRGHHRLQGADGDDVHRRAVVGREVPFRMPGSAWNCRPHLLITLTAALVTAPIASAENQNTSIAPSSRPRTLPAWRCRHREAGAQRGHFVQVAEKSRNAASARRPDSVPLGERLGRVTYRVEPSVRLRMSSGLIATSR